MAIDDQPPPGPEREPPNWWVLIITLGVGAALLGASLVYFRTGGR